MMRGCADDFCMRARMYMHALTYACSAYLQLYIYVFGMYHTYTYPRPPKKQHHTHSHTHSTHIKSKNILHIRLQYTASLKKLKNLTKHYNTMQYIGRRGRWGGGWGRWVSAVVWRGREAGGGGGGGGGGVCARAPQFAQGECLHHSLPSRRP